MSTRSSSPHMPRPVKNCRWEFCVPNQSTGAQVEKDHRKRVKMTGKALRTGNEPLFGDGDYPEHHE